MCMPIETRRTFCRVCHAACPMEVDVEDGRRVVAVRGDRNDPLFEGYTCIKGRQLADQHHDPGRLRAALRRAPDGRFEPVASAAALDDIAARIAWIVDEHGPRAVASYTGTGAYQNSVSLPVASAWHAGFGSPSIYTSLTIDQPAHRSALLRLGAWEAGWQNFTDADVSMAIGYNPLVSSYGPAGGLQGTNPFVMLRRAKERGLRLIVVDPRASELAANADVWLQVQPGEDPTLLAGILRVVLEAGLHDREFCERWVDGRQLDALRAAVEPFTLDVVAERARVPAADLERAAVMFAEGPKGTAGTGTGPNMAPHGTLTEHFALTLNAICGRVLREGEELESGYFLAPGDTRRAQVVPPSDAAPGEPQRVRGLRGLPAEMLTNALSDEILEPGEGQVRALIVSGGNPVVAFPDQAKTLRAMEALDLLVVIDHRMTSTAELADYVIAPRLELERADVPHIQDRRFPAAYTNYTPPVLDTDDDLLSEAEVFVGIAARNGWPIDLPGGSLPLEQHEEITDDDLLDAAYGAGRMTVAAMRSSRGVIHDGRSVRVVAPAPDADARFAVAPPEVVAEIAAVLDEGEGAAVLPGFDPVLYPFRLVSRRAKHVLNSLGRELPGLARVSTTNPAFVHPDDLAELGIEPGELARIASPHAELLGVAESAPEMKRGVVSMYHSWGTGSLTDEKVRDEGTPTNRLVTTDAGTDPITGMAVQSAIPVSVSPVR